MRAFLLLLGLGVTVAACQFDADTPTPPADPAPSSDAPITRVTTIGDDRVPSDDEVEANRLAGRGRALSQTDTTGRAAAERANPETLASLDSTRDWSAQMHLPLGGNVEGPSVLKLQVLLDRAGFTPGQIDGRWGDNTELAVTWAQTAEGLKATGIADEATVRALARLGGAPDSLLTTVTLTEADVAGPFETLPDDVYAKAELDALGYESLGEKLGETYHAAPALLARLNPGVTLDSLRAGDKLRVPHVMGMPSARGTVDRIEISAEGGFLHAVAADGTVLFHAPVTVGSSYDPSPDGDFRVTAIAHDPSWHYQPSILESVPDDQPEATLPGGPNNAVGVVWMALSKEHYGIHGTSAPGTIGYASSAGCVRLTNWDAERLAGLIQPGVTVRFLEGTTPSSPASGGSSGARRDSTQTV